MTQTELIQLTVELTDVQAWQLAQFLKRTGFSDFKQKTVNDDDDDTYAMQEAAGVLKRALTEAGYDPR